MFVLMPCHLRRQQGKTERQAHGGNVSTVLFIMFQQLAMVLYIF